MKGSKEMLRAQALLGLALPVPSRILALHFNVVDDKECDKQEDEPSDAESDDKTLVSVPQVSHGESKNNTQTVNDIACSVHN